MSTTRDLIERIGGLGFSRETIEAALPAWWTTEEENSSSAQTLIALLLARRLSLDPESLLNAKGPAAFLQFGPTKFKHLRLSDGPRLQALTAFSQGVSRIVFAALGELPTRLPLPSADVMRQSILDSGRSHVAFGDVLTLCWSLGIPVLHLRLFPATGKGITAMSVRQGDRYAILVARESGVPAQYMFHISHELGHIALGHLADTAAIVDADPLDPANSGELLIDDAEEQAADEFAQVLLSGMADFRVDRAALDGSRSNLGTARELAEKATSVGVQYGIDPGHVVMCFGRTTGEWPIALAAAKLIPDQDEIPGTLVNRVLWQQIGEPRDFDALSFLRAVAVA